MLSKHVYALLIIIVFQFLAVDGVNLNAQTEDCQDCVKIKRDKNYYWADGEGVTYDEAMKMAKTRLAGKINDYISTWISDSTSYLQKGTTGQTTKLHLSVLQSYSAVVVNDIECIVLSPEPRSRVFIYVAKAKAQSVLEVRRKWIKDYVDCGKRAEKNLQIDEALRNYYWALMLSTTIPDDVVVEFNGEKGFASSMLSSKIRSVINGLRCKFVEMKENRYGEYEALYDFTYNGNTVASLRYKYFDGFSIVGPVNVKDGRGEMVLQKLPPEGKIDIYYEYSYLDEAKQLRPGLFDNINAIYIEDAKQNAVMKVDKDKGKKDKDKQTATTSIYEIQPEAINNVMLVDVERVTNTKPYEEAIRKVEQAIKMKDAAIAYQYMTTDCFELFDKMLKSIDVQLSKQWDYNYVLAGGQVLCRFMYVKLKELGGKTFMDKLVFRFSPKDKKIQSFAFGLSNKAESDIFDAAKTWSTISRFTILNFMEDYQTAFALMREDYIRSIYSDDAVIIVGNVLRTQEKRNPEKNEIVLNSDKRIWYNRYSRDEYIKHLHDVFQKQAYVHLTFEDNTTMLLNTNGRIPEGRAFGIQIRQRYNSSSYSDEGYLTLMMRMDLENPIIVVRYWQPGKEAIIDMDNFFSTDNFTY